MVLTQGVTLCTELTEIQGSLAVNTTVNFGCIKVEGLAASHQGLVKSFAHLVAKDTYYASTIT